MNVNKKFNPELLYVFLMRFKEFYLIGKVSHYDNAKKTATLENPMKIYYQGVSPEGKHLMPVVPDPLFTETTFALKDDDWLSVRELGLGELSALQEEYMKILEAYELKKAGLVAPNAQQRQAIASK